MSAMLIRSLNFHLPCFAEEEGDFYSVPREALINELSKKHQFERAIAENTIALLESEAYVATSANTFSRDLGVAPTPDFHFPQ